MSDIVLDSKAPTGPIEDRWTKHKFDMKLVNPANKRKFDIIVVGTGLAGAAAAASLAWVVSVAARLSTSSLGLSRPRRADVKLDGVGSRF